MVEYLQRGTKTSCAFNSILYMLSHNFRFISLIKANQDRSSLSHKKFQRFANWHPYFSKKIQSGPYKFTKIVN